MQQVRKGRMLDTLPAIVWEMQEEREDLPLYEEGHLSSQGCKECKGCKRDTGSKGRKGRKGQE